MDHGYDLIKEAIAEIVSYLNINYTLRDVPRLNYKKIIVESNSIKVVEEPQLLFTDMLLKIELGEIVEEKLPKTKMAIDFFLKYLDLTKLYKSYGWLDGQPIIPFFSSSKFYFDATLKVFANNYFNAVQNFEFKESIIKEIYTEWELQKQSTSIEEIAFIPLYGFNMESPLLEFPNGLTIEAMSEFDYQYIFNHQAHSVLPSSQKLELQDFLRTKFKLCKKYSYDLSEAPSQIRELVNKNFKDIVIALRLIKSGQFCPVTVFTSAYSTKRKYYFDNWHYHQNIFEVSVYRNPLMEYRLLEADIPELYRILGIFSDDKLKKELKALEVGLKKFNDIYSKISFEEQVLDLATALDSSILYDDNASNFYKLRVRCALLVKGRFKINVFKFSEYLISRRNDIIHKGKSLEESLKKDKLLIDSKQYSIGEFVGLSSQLVREILKEYLFTLRENYGIKAINNDLEQKHF